MAIRTVAELITEIRFNANKVNTNRFTDEALIRFLDSAQRQIQMVIYNAYPQDPIFSKTRRISIVQGQTEYSMPKDMLTPNSIFSVIPERLNGTYGDPLRRLSLGETTHDYGYFIVNGKLGLAPPSLLKNFPQGNIRFTYAPKLTRLTAVGDTPSVPEICEEFLTLFAERKIHYVDSSEQVRDSQVFTQQERQDIAQLFADSARDVKHPPILNDDYMNF